MTTTTTPVTKKSDPDKTKVKELQKQLRKARKTIDKQQAEIDDLSPTIDIRSRLFKTGDDVKKYYGDQKLRDLAEAQLVDENRIRRRSDLSPIRYTEEEWEAAVELVVEELLSDRAIGAPEDGPLMRTLKMWNPKDDSIRQIPYEGQINNVAGSLADGVILYERKGFKRLDPFLCPAGNCDEEADIVSKGKDKGKWRWDGYCSEDHFLRTEKRNQAELPGVVNRASVSAGSG